MSKQRNFKFDLQRMFTLMLMTLESEYKYCEDE